MKKLQSDTDLVYLQPKFLTKKECKHYLKKAIGPTALERQAFAKDREANNAYWHKRLVNMTRDPIVNRVKKFLDKKFNLNLEIAEDLLQDLLRASDRRTTIDQIQKKVAEHFNVKISDMHSARRSRAVARPRQIAMFLAKNLTSRSLPEIGRKFGGRDHTTVIHAIKKVQELTKNDSSLSEDIEILTRSLQS